MSTPAQAPVERFVDISGRPVRVRVHGQGPPVLLINGLGANVASWTPLLKQLAGFEVISFDAPGAGRSGAPRAPYPISRIAEAARRVLDELGHQRADVLGYSLGGAVAQTLAFEHPERVRRMVLVSTSCGTGGVPGSLRSLMAVSTPARHYTETGHRLTMKLLDLAPAERESGLLERQPIWHREAAPPVLGYLLQMAAFSAFNSLPWLHNVHQPTLILTGSDDRLIPMANAAILGAYLPNARVQVVERWGHYMLHDPASGAGAAVANFVRAKSHVQSSAWREALTITPEEMGDIVRRAPRSAHFGRVTGGWVRQQHPARNRSD